MSRPARPFSRDAGSRRRGSPRVIAGTRGGRRIAAPPGRGTRPTTDRVREALFSSLAGLTDLRGCRFADLYAGSGAVGIEALSRGAVHALFVESAPASARVLRENLAALDLTASAEVATAPAAKVLAVGPARLSDPAPYDVIFADPPYELADVDLEAVLACLVADGWIADNGVVAVERSSRGRPLPWVPGLTGLRSRRYGETTLWYGRAS